MFQVLKVFFMLSLFAFGVLFAICEAAMIRVNEDRYGCPLGNTFTEIEISFKDGNELFSKIKASELQKSLFYQGFMPEFFPNGSHLPELDYRYAFNEMPFDEALRKPPVIIDAQKAFEYATSALKKNYYSSAAVANLASLYLSGIACKKNEKKAFELLKKSMFFEMTKEYLKDNINQSVGDHMNLGYLIAYFYYYGICVERDVEKCNLILKFWHYRMNWRNFYCGHTAPKDTEFAIHILETSDEFWCAQTLMEIYEGKYYPEHADAKKSAHWKKIYEERSEKFIKNFNENERIKIENDKEAETLNKLRDRLHLETFFVLYGSKVRILSKEYAYENFTFKNPFYDESKVSELLDKLENSKNAKKSFRKINKAKKVLEKGLYEDLGKGDSLLLAKLARSSELCEAKSLQD